MFIPDDPQSALPLGGSWIVHRYEVSDSGSSYAGMGRLEAARRQRPLPTPDITAVLEDMIGPLRRLDDTEGGCAATIGMVQQQIKTITAYLTRGRTTSPAVRRRLMLASAQFHQLAGWMAFDAERHATARRYFRAGLTAAHEGDYTDLVAHILACMAYQAVHCGELDEANQFARKAVLAADGCHPVVRALTSSRLAYVYAASGNVHGFRSVCEKARDQHQNAGVASHGPEWLYWFDEEALEYQLAHSVLALAAHASSDSHRYIAEAEILLSGKVAAPDTSTPRDALFHTASLARVHAQYGDLGSAVRIADLGLRHVELVRSTRVFNVLRALDKDLVMHRGARRDPQVRDLRSRLRELRI